MKEGDMVYHWPFMSTEPKSIGVLFERDDDDDAWLEDKAPRPTWNVLIEGQMKWIRTRDLRKIDEDR